MSPVFTGSALLGMAALAEETEGAIWDHLGKAASFFRERTLAVDLTRFSVSSLWLGHDVDQLETPVFLKTVDEKQNATDPLEVF